MKKRVNITQGFTFSSEEGIACFQLHAGWLYHVRWNYDLVIVSIWRLSITQGDVYGYQVDKE